MSSIPTEGLSFRWPWRSYQARLLASAERHLEDDRLHLVAPPGAGKTSLGLEVFRRLGKPALVLAPTLAIRDQWLLRLEDFVPEAGSGSDPTPWSGWTSTDLALPAFLTVTTYQALLARQRSEAFRHEDEPEIEPDSRPSGEDVASALAAVGAAGVGTLILDEAHHLRQEWWKALTQLAEGVPDLTLVSLTATPPYDATGREWLRYEELCGPIDDEIGVPELVRSGTLCPHQDFVLAVAPGDGEVADVREREKALDSLLGDLFHDPGLAAQIESHPWVNAAEPDPEQVMERPEVAFALLVHLRARGASLPEGLLALLEIQGDELPLLDRRWWQVLLAEYLFGSSFPLQRKPHRDRLAARLREAGFLWRRDLRIDGSRQAERRLASSAAKVGACVDVHRLERQTRGASLRQVVLTDFIRDEGWDEPPRDVPPSLGALPVFDALVASWSQEEASRSPGPGPEGIALLTGRLCILHRSRLSRLLEALGNPELPGPEPAPHRDGWVRIAGVHGSRMVGAYTRLLAEGHLTVLVGTRALLGEGWDAPAVNSLVLASYVGSFVTTNQMRGRAIRSDPATPDKVASVWHIAALVPGLPAGLLDMTGLEERFRTFVGLSADGALIESGIGRLALPPVLGPGDIGRLNALNRERYARLEDVRRGWSTATEGARVGAVVPTVRSRRPPNLGPFHLRRTLRYLLLELGSAAMVGLAWSLPDLLGEESLRGFAWALAVTVVLVALRLFPELARAARLALHHLPVDGSVGEMGEAVLEALRATELVRASPAEARVLRERLGDGSVNVSLSGGTFQEQSTFANAVAELLGPVGNPRYLITRRGKGSRRKGIDYHAVPKLLAVNKDRAEALLSAWHRHVGPGELVFTRREGGRRVLLAARARAFSNAARDPAERLDRWQ